MDFEAAAGGLGSMMSPRFIVLDGMDGAGKSSQLGRLADWLGAGGR